ncbi:MAG: bifunctional methionine sulfoxide reductase B/A protein [Candidatus Omnitrophota bacterium]|jgi:peptide methionine sulfoxide reductase msrA/msrB|nr:MAG: bifunctional methionine sulfoxide reductase B/A protein [Candidatus Omnitrophota bacterium]
MDSNLRNEKIKIYNAITGKVEIVAKIYKTDQEWKKILTPEQFEVTRLKGTESPFSKVCPIPSKGEEGIYQCVGCGTDLFIYKTKFDSGTGWPSFWEPVSELNVRIKPDNSFGIQRLEVVCARCDAHLGHVFDDGPPPTGKRYCINTLALKLAIIPAKVQTETATFAAGCFWGVEAAFRQLIGKGVISTRVGYTGGHFKNPTYEDVCSGKTGHAEAVEIVYDPAKISYSGLLDIFWDIHDPTALNRQGPDVGTQYRSAIFFHTKGQEMLALESREKLDKSKKFKNPVVTQIVKALEFYPAEDYHQDYYKKHGLKPSCHIR